MRTGAFRRPLAFAVLLGISACHGTGKSPESATNAPPRPVAHADPCGPARTWRAVHTDSDLTHEVLRNFPAECYHTVLGMPPDRCDAAHTWVYKNHGGVISYDALISFPVECRKFIYEELPRSARRALWIAQFERYKATHPTMTEEQRAVLARAIAVASSERFDAQPGSPEWPASEAERGEQIEQAVRVLGKDEVRTLFAQLGPADPEGLHIMYGAPKP